MSETRMTELRFGELISSLLGIDTSSPAGQSALVSFVGRHQEDLFSLPPRYKALLVHSLHLRSVKASGSFAVPADQAGLDFWLIESLFLHTHGQELTLLKLSLDGLALGDDLFSASSPHHHRDRLRGDLRARKVNNNNKGFEDFGSSSSPLSSSTTSTSSTSSLASSSSSTAAVSSVAAPLRPPLGVRMHHDLLALMRAFLTLPSQQQHHPHYHQGRGTVSASATHYHPSFSPSGERDRSSGGGGAGPTDLVSIEASATHAALTTGPARAERLLAHFRAEGVAALKEWNRERAALAKERLVQQKAREMLSLRDADADPDAGHEDDDAGVVVAQSRLRPFWPVKLFSDFDDTMAPKLWDKSFPSSAPQAPPPSLSLSLSSSSSASAAGSGSAAASSNGGGGLAGAVPYPGVAAFIHVLTGGHLKPPSTEPPAADASSSSSAAAQASASNDAFASSTARALSAAGPSRIESPSRSHAPGAVARSKRPQASTSASTSSSVPTSEGAAEAASTTDALSAEDEQEIEEQIQSFSLAEFLGSDASHRAALNNPPSPARITTSRGVSNVSRRLPMPSSPLVASSSSGAGAGSAAILPGTASVASRLSSPKPLPEPPSTGSAADGSAASSGAAGVASFVIHPDDEALNVTVTRADVREELSLSSRRAEEDGGVTAATSAITDDADGDESWVGHYSVSGTVYLSARPAVMKSMTLQTVLSTVLEGRPPRAILCGTIMTSFTNASLARKKFENFLQYSRLYPEFRVVWLGDSGQGDIEAGRRMIEAYRRWQQEMEDEHKASTSSAGLASADGTTKAKPHFWWPPPPPLVLIHDIATGSSSSSSSSSGSAPNSLPPAPSFRPDGTPAPMSDAAAASSGSSSGSKRLTPPLERAKLRAQGIHLFDSYLDAALVAYQCGRDADDDACAPSPLLSKKGLLHVLDKTAQELGRVRFSSESQRAARLEEFTDAVKRVNLALEREDAKAKARAKTEAAAEAGKR